MNELIKVTENDGKQVVNARDLHAFLESGQDFSTWIKNRIGQYSFIEGEDYLLHKVVEQHPSGSKTKIEYALTIDAAKELAMVEGNERGRQARRYFIECEKKLKMIAKPINTIDGMILALQELKATQERISQIEDKLHDLEAHSITRSDWYAVSGFASKHKIPVGRDLAKFLGIEAAKLCRQEGIIPDKVSDPKFGFVNSYPANILLRVFRRYNILKG